MGNNKYIIITIIWDGNEYDGIKQRLHSQNVFGRR